MRVATGDAVPLRRRLQAVVLLMMLTAIQLIFAYTYADAASVMTVNQRTAPTAMRSTFRSSTRTHV